jgi:hypothetical protein
MPQRSYADPFHVSAISLSNPNIRPYRVQVTDCRVECPGFNGLEQESFFFFWKFQTNCGAYPAWYSMSSGVFSGLNGRRRAVNNSPPSSEVTNWWNYTSTLPFCFLGAYRENFVFLSFFLSFLILVRFCLSFSFFSAFSCFFSQF